MERPTKRACHKRICTDENYSDHWNTPKSAYKLLLPFIKQWQEKTGKKSFTIWDPFYCKGHAKDYLEEVFKPLGATVIHSEIWIDLDVQSLPDFAKTADIIITNPPYSKTNKLDTTRWLMSLNIPFCSIMPTEFMMAKKFRPYVRSFQFVCPSGRVRFERDGVLEKKNATVSSTWYVKNMCLEKDINFC